MKPTGNEYFIDEQYLIGKLSVRGERTIDGNCYGDEITHGAFDSNAYNQGIIVSDKSIEWANNGDYLEWRTYQNRVIKNTIPGMVNNSTSYWGKGTFKKTVYVDGCIALTIHKDKNGKYFKRVWLYVNELDIENYNRKDSSHFLKGCNVVEYEITEEEFNDIVQPERWGFDVTFYVKVYRFNDSEMSYNASKMMDSINLAMINYDGRLHSFVEVDGKRVESQQLYYGTVEDLGDESYRAVSHFSKLPLVKKNYKIGDGVFNIYLYKTLEETSDEFKKWETLNKDTNGGKNIIRIKGRGLNPRQIWINRKGTTLSTYDAWTNITGSTPTREQTQGTVMVLHQVAGDYEFPEIKTEKPTDKVLEQVGHLHSELVQANKSIQYSKKKKEDSKVEMVAKHLTEGLNKTYQLGLTESILTITEDSLSRLELRNEDNIITLSTQQDGREYDLIITNRQYEPIFHAEFQNGAEDWGHIDSVTYRTVSGTAKYNVLVVDKISRTSKRRQWKEVLEKKDIGDSVVYLVTLSDFLNGNTDKFKRIK